MERSDGIYPLCFALGALRLVLALATDETFGAEASVAALLAAAAAIGWLHDRRPNLDAVLMRTGGRPPASPRATPCTRPPS